MCVCFVRKAMLGACPFLSMPYTLRKAMDKLGKRLVEGEGEKFVS